MSNPQEVSEHRAHPTKYKISVRQRGAGAPLRTWGPYDTKEQALEAIDRKREEARSRGWGDLVFELVRPTEAWSLLENFPNPTASRRR